MKALFTVILSLFSLLNLAAQCTAFAGSSQSLTFNLCAGQPFDVSTLGDEVITNSDTLVFVVHNGGPTTLGNIVDANSTVTANTPPSTGHFEWSANYQPGVTYQITAYAGLGNGNGPFGIDLSDPCLSVSPVGTVTYNPAPMTCNGSDSLTLTCTQNSVVLFTPYACTGQNPNNQWLWTGPNGYSEDIATPNVTMSGNYCATVTSPAGCTSTACVMVGIDTVAPVVDAGPDMVLNCVVNVVTLGATVSGDGNNNYYWTGGVIAAGGSSLNPIVASPGTYCVTVTSISNGCTATDCVLVFQDTDLPIADAGPDFNPPCNDLVPVTFGGPNTSVGPAFIHVWFNGNGDVLGTTPTLIATQPGTYTLMVTGLNGCTDSDFVEYLTTPDIISPNVFPSALPCGGGPTIIGLSNALPLDYEGMVLSWTTADGNIVSQTDTISILVDQAGTYCFTAVDTINGCTLTGCDTVYDEINLSLFVPDVVCASGTTTLRLRTVRPLPDMMLYNIFIELEGFPVLQETNFSEPDYYFQVPFDEERLVKIWVEDQAGDCVSDTLTRLLGPFLQHSIAIEEDGCNPVIATVSLDVPNPSGYDIQWLNAQGAVLSNLISVSITSSGWYFVEIKNEQGTCTWTDSIYVEVPFAGNCATISGNALRNLNSDCLPNPADTPLFGWLVQAVGVDTFYATSDANGNYSMPVDPGSYVVSIVPANAFWVPCGNDFPVNLPNPDDEATLDFLMKKLPGCPEMFVDISTPLLRRCFTSTYFVNYCNQGVEPATDAYVTVDLDDFLTFNSASLPHTDLGNNVYRFDLGDLDVGECGSFNIVVAVSCNAALGQTHCTEAHIYPDTTCVPPSPLWSGASLQLTSVCDGDSLRFNVTNIGTAPMTQAMDFVVIEDAVMYMQTPPPGPTLGVGESFILSVLANGATWRMVVAQEPFHPIAAAPIVAVEGCGNSSFSTGFVNQFPMGDDPLFLDIDCTPNVGSYDPNDKQGFPIGYGDEHQILPGTELQYLIRFQNTGTDTAFTVVIRDTLSTLLDIATVRPGASSHPCQFETYSEGVLKFTFNDILLPDSSTNQAGSNGFVHFTAKPRADLPLGSVIENEAAIYFDFNEPVLTNTVFHTVDSNFVMVNQVDYALRNVQLEIMPNPFEDRFSLGLKGYPNGKTLTFSVFDATGRLIAQQKFTSPRLDFKSQGLAEGLYFFKIEDAGRLIATGKVVSH